MRNMKAKVSPNPLVTTKRSAPTFAVVIPTKNRLWSLKQLLPPISKAGFDEVIVVDSSDTCQRDKVKALCDRLNLTHYFRNCNAEVAKNIGAALSHSEWLYFLDDDGLIITEFHKELLLCEVNGYDFMSRSERDLIWIFRRKFFLEIGGYDENLWQGEDFDISMRARARGKRCELLEGIFECLPVRKDLKSDFKRLITNAFNVGLTKVSIFKKYPQVSLRTIVWLFLPGGFRRTVFKDNPYGLSNVVMSLAILSLIILEFLGEILSPVYVIGKLQKIRI